MRAALERYFEFSRLNTNWRTEFFAGVTTFVTMAYIVLVNPAILAKAGIPLPAVTAATCLSAAFGCILMGIIARYPIALAPGMGLNAYFTYTVVLQMHVPWQTALGAVFISGVAFLLLTACGIRQLILRSIPAELYAAVAGGIGLFIAFIGLHNAGIIVPHPETLITLGNIRSPQTALALLGVILIGVVAITLAALPFHLVHWQRYSYTLHDVTQTMFRLDIRSAIHIGLFEIIFVFFFVDLFDNLGTLVAVAKKAGLIEHGHEIPRLNSILFADAAATVVGSLAGTSTVTSYVESTAGVAVGGRSGVTAIVTGLGFFLALFAAPLVGIIPTAATAPALIIVGSLMLSTVTEINWTEPLSAIPAFLTLVMIPLSASIANGLGFGVISYAAVHILGGKFRRQDWLLYVLAVLFLIRFIYVAQA